VAVNAGGGSSIVGQTLRRIPVARPYLQLLMMDVAYDFQLAGTEDDAGVHRLELFRGGAKAEPAPLAVMPDDSIKLRIRRQRYEQLAYNIAYFDELFKENSDLRTQLPLAMAEGWIRSLKLPTESYVLRCQKIPSKRLPKATEADISYAYVMREGGLAQEKVEKPLPPPINIFMVWSPDDAQYQGSREAPSGQAAEVALNPSPPRREGRTGVENSTEIKPVQVDAEQAN
jgi:hypothetical protein